MLDCSEFPVLERERVMKIIIIAGETSGDIHGAALARELKFLRPGTVMKGIGGSRMKAEGVQLFQDLSEFNIMGITEVIRHIPRIRRLIKETASRIIREKPDALVLIDYPDFNFRIGKRVHSAGIPVIYHICPQLWAWRRKRTLKMARFSDLMTVILPFEKEFFASYGIEVEFIGHPLKNRYPDDEDEGNENKAERVEGIDLKRPYIALLPGSRISEIQRMLPPMLQAALQMTRERNELQAVICKAESIDDDLLRLIFQQTGISFPIVQGMRPNVIKNARAVVTTSGTATLETALHFTPMVVCYQMSKLSYFIAKRLVKVPYIALTNLTAGRKLVPELIQSQVTPENIVRELEFVMSEPQRSRIVEGLKEVSAKLGEPGASQRAARLIADFIRSKKNHGCSGKNPPKSPMIQSKEGVDGSQNAESSDSASSDRI